MIVRFGVIEGELVVLWATGPNDKIFNCLVLIVYTTVARKREPERVVYVIMKETKDDVEYI
jgi:hypothetical protein